MVKWKEVAKFLSGAAAWEAFGHALLAATGSLPIAVLWITLDQTTNALIIVISVVAAVGLAYYGWKKK